MHDEPNDTTEMWREHRRNLQQVRADQRVPRVEEIRALDAAGYSVRELSPYHFRIDDVLDLFPTHRRYHHIPTNTRGPYRKALDVAVALVRRKV